MKVLVLGSTGFIGTRVCGALSRAGHEVVAAAWTDDGIERLAAGGRPSVRADIRYPETACAAAGEMDAVVNLAFAADDPPAEIRLAEVLIAALAGSGKTLLWTSGVGVVGPSGPTVFDEQAPLVLGGPFGWRARGEALVRGAAADGVRTVVIRPPIVHADGDAAVLGLLGMAAQGGDAVPYPGTGEHHWSTVHVDDLADLYLLALEAAAPGTVYIAASEHQVTMRDLATHASNRLGLDGRTVSMPLEDLRLRIGPMADLLASPAAFSGDLARRELGWSPHSPALLVPLGGGA